MSLEQMRRKFIHKHHYYFKINKNLIPIKVASFIHAFGGGAIYSYLSIQARSLGLTASQIGLILAILPVAVLVGPPLLSPLADKLQKHKLFLIVFLLLSAVCHVALTAVPRVPSSAQHHLNLTNFTSDSGDLMMTQPRHRHRPSNDNHEPNRALTTRLPEDNTSAAYAKEHDYTATIIETIAIYAIIRLIAQTCGAVSHTFTDAITFGLINKYGGKHNKRLGFNRFWQVAGSSLSAPFAGFLMDHFSKGDRNQRNFLPGFIVNVCAALATAVIVAFMEVTVEVKPKKVLKNVGGLLRQPPFTVFLLAILMTGCNFGFSIGFTSLFFDELGATATQIGLASTIAHVCALPLVFFSKSVIDRTGHVPLIIATFFAYASRYIGLSVVPSMGYVYILEAVEGLMQGLLMTAAAEFGFIMTPPGMTATVQALIHISHFAIGKGIGSLVGGAAFDTIGPRRSFLIYGITNASFGTIYLTLHVLWLRKITKQTEATRNRTESTIISMITLADKENEAIQQNSMHF